MNINVLFAFIASIGTWGLTALGATTVLFFKNPKQSTLNVALGFSAGVMIAASFWSLLQPALELANNTLKTPAYIVVTLGFILGSIFIWLSDRVVTKTLIKTNKISLLIMAITLHNIPEGLVVGVAFGLLKDGFSSTELMSAILIAVGIGLQNFPEGAAVSLPLRREGYSRKKAFFLGQLSAIVEPVAAVVGAMLVSTIETFLPFALSFAAGAMIIVSVHELIPECQQNKNEKPYTATAGIILGFSVMMLFDVMLG